MISFIISVISASLAYFFWIVQKLVRPVTALTVVCALCQPSEAKRKFELLYQTVLFLTRSKDKKWSKPKVDPGTAKMSGNVTTKTIIFIRHGESTWNDTFNRGGRPKMSFILNFIPNLIYALALEWYLFVSGKDNESWFYDSPLSQKGVQQGKDLRAFLQQSSGATKSEKEIIKLILGQGEDENDNSKEPSSQLVSSNLRRAITTMALGLQDRLDRKYPNDSIVILPELQEISINPDALSITPPHGKVLPSFRDHEITTCDLPRIYKEQVSTKEFHYGNKALDSNGLERIQSFCDIVFNKIDKDVVIAAGHSLWFRSFFQTYLPWNLEHKAKKKKLVNGGCVSFSLHKVLMDNSDDANCKEKEVIYCIDPKSINIIYGGF